MTHHPEAGRHSKQSGSQSEITPAINEPLKQVLEKLLQTHEVRSLLTESIPIGLKAWAGKQGVKQVAAKIISGFFKLGFSESQGSRDAKLEALFANPEFLGLLAQLLAGIYAGHRKTLITGIKTLEALDPQDQINFINQSLSPLLQGGSADILTGCAHLLNTVHQSDPTFLVRLVSPGFKTWVQSADFGEFKQAVDASAEDIVSLVEMANEVLWEYPAKVVLCFSLLPAFINILGRSILVSADKLEEIPPDLLTDIVISLVREIDASVIAALVDTVAEIIRKLHTGSALLGEAGKPQLTGLFSEKTTQIVGAINPASYWQARIQLAEIKGALDQALADTVHQNPAFLELYMRESSKLSNLRWHRLNAKLTQSESLDDDAFVRLWSQRLAQTNAQEAAEVCNNFLYLANRLAEQSPEAWVGIISRFTHALDADALAETADRIFQNNHGDLLPPARAMIPNLVTWICRVLEPADDGFDEDAARARQAIRELLKTAEV